MVHRRSQFPTGRKLLANHNRAWIWGRNVVAETLRAGVWPMLELAVSRTVDAKSAEEFTRLAAAAGLSVNMTDDAGVTKLCRAADHQGCAAKMAEFPYLTDKAFRQRLSNSSIIVVLDRVQDPFNFGAIIRNVECLGLDGVVIGSVEQTGVNSQAARSSAGAVNHVPICRVENLGLFVSSLSDSGWQIWGASERGALPVQAAGFRPPLALVIGNEGVGIHPDLLAKCTGTVQIPMSGRVGSLNAAVSAGILCYEAVRLCRSNQRN